VQRSTARKLRVPTQRRRKYPRAECTLLHRGRRHSLSRKGRTRSTQPDGRDTGTTVKNRTPWAP
jgi:hypothetical protein